MAIYNETSSQALMEIFGETNQSINRSPLLPQAQPNIKCQRQGDNKTKVAHISL